jgi:magnesium transporter
MIQEFKNGSSVWIDVTSPTKDEVKELMERFRFGAHIADDILTPGIKTKVEYVKDYMFLALYFPLIKRSRVEQKSQEIDFILGKNFLITVHYEPIDAIDLFAKLYEVDSVLKRNPVDHAGSLFYHILTRLYESSLHHLESIQDSLEHIETRIFKGEEKKVVRELLVLSSDLIHFKQTIGAHEETLSSFKIAAGEMFDTEYAFYVNGILSAYQKIYKEIRNKREFLFELRETNDSMLNSKQSEIMRILTMMAFFTFPLSLIVALFALPTKWQLVMGTPMDFPIIIGVLLGVLLLMVIYFKNKRWM